MLNTPTFIIPGLFWLHSAEQDYLIPQLKLPNFNKLLTNSNVTKIPNKYLSDWVYKYPHAKELAKQILNKGELDKYSDWLYVEPTHLRVDRDRLLISEPELLQLNDMETEQLLTIINNHFDSELSIHKYQDNLWLMGCNIDVSEIKSYPIIDIIGENIDEFLHSGNHSLKISSLMNEIQMLLFDQPLNNLRQAEGFLSVNSIWIWNKSFNSQPTLISNNNAIGNPITDLTAQVIAEPNSFIYLDNLLYSAQYRDSFAWLNNLNQFDKNITSHLLSILDSVKEVNIIIPVMNHSVSIRIKKPNIFNLLTKNTYVKLANQIITN